MLRVSVVMVYMRFVVVGVLSVPYIALIDGVTMGGVSDNLCSIIHDLALLHSVNRFYKTFDWRHGITVSNVGRINEVNHRRARLVLGLVTIFGG